MTRKLERSPLYGVDCHESMGAPLNDHLSDFFWPGRFSFFPFLCNLSFCGIVLLVKDLSSKGSTQDGVRINAVFGTAGIQEFL